jgi:predicted RNase H-like HicB family nuclease
MRRQYTIICSSSNLLDSHISSMLYFLRINKEEQRMLKDFTLEYWKDDGWYVGKLKEIPGVFSQGETLQELEDNIRDAYNEVMKEEASTPHRGIKTKVVEIDV